MKNSDFVRIGKQLLPRMPGYDVKGPMIFRRPIDHVLQGLCFEGSSFDNKSFYVWAFILPLFIPVKYLNFNFGRRLRHGGGDRWSVDLPNLLEILEAGVKTEASVILEDITSLDAFVSKLELLCNKENLHFLQAIGYSLALDGQTSSAIHILGKLEGELESTIPWQKEMKDRSKHLKDLLVNDPPKAELQLNQWEYDSMVNLKIV